MSWLTWVGGLGAFAFVGCFTKIMYDGWAETRGARKDLRK